MIRQLFRRWSAIIFLALVTSAVPVAAHAANFTYDTEVTYSVRPDGVTTDVTERYTIVNKTPRFYLTELQLSTPSEAVTGLAVTYEDGGAIAAKASAQSTAKGDVKVNYQRIDLNFPRQIYGQDKRWGFSVKYETTGLADVRGGAHTVYVPSIEPTADITSYRAIVEVPEKFGGPHFVGAKASSQGKRGDRQYYTFEQSELQKHSLALSFGDLNKYEFDFAFPLKNSGILPQTQHITLPPNLNNQAVTITRLDPQPIATRVDSDGNLIADYKLNPGQSLTVHTGAVISVQHKTYDLTKSGKAADIPADLRKKYTASTEYWDTQGKVAQQAANISDANASVAQNVRSMYQFVIDKLSYNDEKIKFNIRQGADKALANPSNAVCLEYADLLVAMLRSQGIPARMAIGYAYSGDLKASAAVVDSLHSWVEAYVPGVGWITLDPTWGEKFDEFGTSDLDHAAFTVWGAKDDIPGAIMVGGRDSGYQYENAKLTFVDTRPVAMTLPGPGVDPIWLQLGLGVSAIVVIGGVVWILRRRPR